MPDHFERLLAVDDEVDEIALTAGQLFDYILCCGPDVGIRAWIFAAKNKTSVAWVSLIALVKIALRAGFSFALQPAG